MAALPFLNPGGVALLFFMGGVLALPFLNSGGVTASAALLNSVCVAALLFLNLGGLGALPILNFGGVAALPLTRMVRLHCPFLNLGWCGCIAPFSNSAGLAASHSDQLPVLY